MIGHAYLDLEETWSVIFGGFGTVISFFQSFPLPGVFSPAFSCYSLLTHAHIILSRYLLILFWLSSTGNWLISTSGGAISGWNVHSTMSLSSNFNCFSLIFFCQFNSQILFRCSTDIPSARWALNFEVVWTFGWKVHSFYSWRISSWYFSLIKFCLCCF